MLQISGLRKSFGDKTILESIDMHVHKGVVYGLVGPNGAGKTTLIKTLLGIYKRDEGTVMMQGQEIYENNVSKEKIVFIPDDLYFFFNYKVIDMAHYYSGIYPSWSWERFEALKAVFKMDPNQKISKMSKGMKRQVAFWMVLSTKTEMMVLDEPVDGLDPISRKQVWSLVLQDVAEYQRTVLVSSHNLRELEDICDYVGIIHDGKVILEKELNHAKENIQKIQVAFKEEPPHSFFENKDILYTNHTGSVYTVVMRGAEDQSMAYFQKMDPVLLTLLPVSLEELFIYEIGGTGYEIDNIII